MTQKRRHWTRETSETINTGARLPKELHARLARYARETGMTHTEIVIAALDNALPEYNPRDDGVIVVNVR